MSSIAENDRLGYYACLGVAPGTPNIDKEIRNAYHRQAIAFHPDRAGGSTEAFQALAAAHEVLSDQGKREEYDLSHRVDGAQDRAPRSVWGCERPLRPGKTRVSKAEHPKLHKYGKTATVEGMVPGSKSNAQPLKLSRSDGFRPTGKWYEIEEEHERLCDAETAGKKHDQEVQEPWCLESDGPIDKQPRHPADPGKIRSDTDHHEKKILGKQKDDARRIQSKLRAEERSSLETRHMSDTQAPGEGQKTDKEKLVENQKLWKLQGQLSGQRLKELELARKLVREVEHNSLSPDKAKEIFEKAASEIATPQAAIQPAPAEAAASTALVKPGNNTSSSAAMIKAHNDDLSTAGPVDSLNARLASMGTINDDGDDAMVVLRSTRTSVAAQLEKEDRHMSRIAHAFKEGERHGKQHQRDADQLRKLGACAKTVACAARGRPLPIFARLLAASDRGEEAAPRDAWIMDYLYEEELDLLGLTDDVRPAHRDASAEALVLIAVMRRARMDAGLQVEPSIAWDAKRDAWCVG